MNVLVTGATGFTGGHLAQHLISHGDNVRALVRPKSRQRFESSPLPQRGVVAYEGDLVDSGSLGRAMEGVDVVYHIAATYREAGQPDSAYRAIAQFVADAEQAPAAIVDDITQWLATNRT